MKFSDLYNKVFINEQDEVAAPGETEVAVPQDFDDVEPAPVPTPADNVPAEGEITQEQPSEQGTSNLSNYVQELEEFADKLNNIEGESLQKLLADLDKVGTPFDGISERTKGEIVNASKSLQSIAERIKEFIIHAAKNK